MKFVDKTFTEDIAIDYNEFERCEFKDCTVLFHGGDLQLKDVKFINVRFGCRGSADATLAFLRLLRQVNPDLVEELLREPHPHAAPPSITIN